MRYLPLVDMVVQYHAMAGQNQKDGGPISLASAGKPAILASDRFFNELFLLVHLGQNHLDIVDTN